MTKKRKELIELKAPPEEIKRMETAGIVMSKSIFNDIILSGYDYNALQFDVELTGDSAKGISKSDLILTVGKMDKKAYKASDAVDEYIDTFAYGGGMLDLDPDEIGYNEDWMEKTIEGSAMTGNSPEYANAIDTGYGKKINKRRKEGLYNKEKRQGSYNRVKQPVDVAGENTKSGKLNKMFKNLGESEEKKEILSEEMIRMKEMIGYNKKSQ
jgi:hypothetical protein